MHVVSHAITYDNKRFSASDGLRVFANTSPLISTTGINCRLDHVKCVEVLVHRSSPVRKLVSTNKFIVAKLTVRYAPFSISVWVGCGVAYN